MVRCTIPIITARGAIIAPIMLGVGDITRGTARIITTHGTVPIIMGIMVGDIPLSTITIIRVIIITMTVTMHTTAIPAMDVPYQASPLLRGRRRDGMLPPAVRRPVRRKFGKWRAVAATRQPLRAAR